MVRSSVMSTLYPKILLSDRGSGNLMEDSFSECHPPRLCLSTTFFRASFYEVQINDVVTTLTDKVKGVATAPGNAFVRRLPSKYILLDRFKTSARHYGRVVKATDSNPLRSRHLFSSEAQVQVLLVSSFDLFGFLAFFVGDGTVTPYAEQCQASTG